MCLAVEAGLLFACKSGFMCLAEEAGLLLACKSGTMCGQC